MKARGILIGLVVGAVMFGFFGCSQSKQSVVDKPQETKQSLPQSQVPAPGPQDAEIAFGDTNLQTDGLWNGTPTSKDSTHGAAVEIECEQGKGKKGECLLVEATILYAQPYISVRHLSVVQWTDDEVLAEPADSHGCTNDVLLIKVARRAQQRVSKGTTTLTRTPAAFGKDTEAMQKECEAQYNMEPTVYRLVKRFQ